MASGKCPDMVGVNLISSKDGNFQATR